jgi:signal peptidase I
MSDDREQPQADTGPANGKSGESVFSLPLALVTLLIGPLTLQNFMQWIKVIVIAVGITLVIRWCAFEPYKIPSGSMIPTLQINDRILVNKWAYGLRIPFTKIRLWNGREPKRWEMVVFKNVKDDAEHPVLVKRIVALPNEHVQIQDGKILINGNAMALPGDMPPVNYTSSYEMRYGVREHDVPDGHYLVLGDNSGQSSDGRYFGWLPSENMLGPVVAVWWPRSHARDFTGFTHSWWWRSLLAAIALYILSTMFIARTWAVHGTGTGSLQSGDRILVNLLSFGPMIPFTSARLFQARQPRRGELVVYSIANDSNGSQHLHIGHVAALGGDRLEFHDNQLLINGQPQTTPVFPVGYVSKLQIETACANSTPNAVDIPPGHLFVFSDDIADESDSRSLGPIPMSAVIGPVSRIVWPLARWRRIQP